ncbi:hypothetical protein FisN_2HuN08 [Fistulifera solaris]|jgi:hypothetical protein|uniref:Uncharacterized protein n=1 Tax=Fistulifera solaris TaxID=1519565 RepID=A0A1Z5JGF2_FISSO|nr:hypothetical protein FisN_2HuN08 [Fistulifera solaris]|eukprot:GAX13006.1 hypothetical protein FisN_2HuN08 [Fistulifera solaris]
MAPRNNNKKKQENTGVSPVYAGSAIDRSFFESLTDEKLAQHVFPLPVDNKSKLEIIYHFIDEFFRRFRLRVTHNATEKKWYPGTSPGDDLAGKPWVHAFREDKRFKYCDLYCSACRSCHDTCAQKEGSNYTKFHGEVSVVATIAFESLSTANEGETMYRGTVSRLYYHHVHNDGGDLKQLMIGGWCVLSTPQDSAGVYAKAMAHCKEYLHPDKGTTVQQHESLLPINLASGKRSKDNRYYLMMSDEGESWDERLVNACCNDKKDGTNLVELEKHQQVIVSLFYAICCKLGLQDFASPFIYPMSEFRVQSGEENRRVNPLFRLFCNEESLLAGGFADEGSSVPAQQLHCDHADSDIFYGTTVSQFPPKESDLGQLLAAGMSFIHPLSDKGRHIQVLKSLPHIQPHQTLVFLGNVAHGGVTHLLKKDKFLEKLTWPALHGHIDVKTKKREVGLLTYLNKDITHLNFEKLEPKKAQNKKSTK